MFLAIFLIVFSAIILRNIRYGAYLIIFSMPLYLWRFSVLRIPSTALEAMIYVLFIVWLFRNYRGASFGNIKKQLIDFIKAERILTLGVFLLMAGATLSTIFSSDIKTSAGIFKGWFIDPFLVFIILVSEIKTLKQRENVLKALFFSGLVVAVASLAYLFFPELNGVSYDRRLHGFYLSPNYLAMYLSPALIIGFWLIYDMYGSDVPEKKPNKKNFLLRFIPLFLIAVALYFTYSYAAWFAVFVAAILFFYLSTKKTPSFRGKSGVQAGFQDNNKKFSLSKKTFLLAAIVLFFGALFLAQIKTDKFSDFKNLSYRSSFNSRTMIWRSAWEIGKDNPIIGIGPGNFQKYYLAYQAKFPEPYLEWAVPEPHNIFLAFWLETGIIGFFGFVLILFWFLKHGLNLLKNKFLNKKNYLLAAVSLSLMVYTIIHGLVDTTYWKNDLAIIFWLLPGLITGVKAKQEKY